MQNKKTTLLDNISFWDLAEVTKHNERYKIDKNLKYLKIAPLNILRKIFIQYRFFTHYYIADLALLISKLPFGKLRSILAEILHEELGDGDHLKAHPILYDNFLLSLGISIQELNHANLQCTQILKQVQHSLLKNSWGYGIGLRGLGGECLCHVYLSTMHQFFSCNPSIIAIQNQIEWQFWEIHIGEIDLHHQEILRGAIDNLIATDSSISEDLITGYLESKQAWDQYWKLIYTAAGTSS